jgi:hypothetical protein
MRPDKSIHWRELGDRVARLAADLAGCAAHAHELGGVPPAAVVIGERDLWRWAETLRQASTPPPAADHGRLVAIALLVAVDGRRELTAVADAIVRAAGRQGGWWHVRHVTAYPDPAAIFNPSHPATATTAPTPGATRDPSAGGQERDGGGEPQ